jgi:hypothetical protein
MEEMKNRKAFEIGQISKAFPMDDPVKPAS